MKRLILMRHGSAENVSKDTDDYNRPLSTEGVLEVTFIAEKILQNGILPDRVLASPALRTATTAEIFHKKSAFSTVAPELLPALYNADENTIKSYVSALDDSLKTVLIVGHNPALTNLVRLSMPEFSYMAPAGAVCIEFQAESWSMTDFTDSMAVFSVSP